MIILYYKQTSEDFGISEFGCSHLDKARHVGPYKHNGYLLHFNTEGSVTYLGNTAAVGQAFFIPKQTVYEFQVSPGYTHYWFGFYGKRAESVLRYYGITPESGCVLDVYAKKLCSSMLEQAFLESKNTNDERVALAALMTLLSLCRRNTDQSDAVTDMMFAAELIEKNCCSELKISDIAAAVGLEPKYFSRKFKSRFGVTPIAYLTDIRITKACEMLRDGRYMIKEISFLVGYNSPLAFNMAFRKKKGISPSEYKETHSSDAL